MRNFGSTFFGIKSFNPSHSFLGKRIGGVGRGITPSGPVLFGLESARAISTTSFWDMRDNSLMQDGGGNPVNDYEKVARVEPTYGDLPLVQYTGASEPYWEDNFLVPGGGVIPAISTETEEVAGTRFFADSNSEFYVACVFKRPSSGSQNGTILGRVQNDSNRRVFMTYFNDVGFGVKARGGDVTFLEQSFADDQPHVMQVWWDGSTLMAQVDDFEAFECVVGTSGDDNSKFNLMARETNTSYGFYWPGGVGSTFVSNSALTERIRTEIKIELGNHYGLSLNNPYSAPILQTAPTVSGPARAGKTQTINAGDWI